MCIASFILHWKLCRVDKVTTVPVQHLGWSYIPCWVCSQKTLHCTHIHLKYCWKRCICYFYWKFAHYILFYHWFVKEVQFYIKLLFNWTCGLNSSSKQICLLRCFHLTLALLLPGTWWMLGGKGISYTSHLIMFRSLRAWNLIIWIHSFSFLEDYSCGVVVELVIKYLHIHC
jgi:hypothetical protein